MDLSGLDHEQLHVSRGSRSGAYTIIAVHSTKLGPALGGCRMTTYAHPGEAVDDVLRLSAGMTFKAAVAGVGLGGGKGVIAIEPGTELTHELRDAMLLDFADSVELLGGRYITAEDVGTAPTDMRLIASRTEHVVGLPESLGGLGDPSPYTALGVHAAIRASVAHRFGSPELAGRTAAVVGAGHVGEHLVRMLVADGAQVIVADIDERKRALVERAGGHDLDGAGGRAAGRCRHPRPLRARRDPRPGHGAGAARAHRLRRGQQPARARRARGRARTTAGSSTRPTSSPTPAGSCSSTRSSPAPTARVRGARSATSRAWSRNLLAVADERDTTPLAAAYELAEDRLAAPAGVRA